MTLGPPRVARGVTETGSRVGVVLRDADAERPSPVRLECADLDHLRTGALSGSRSTERVWLELSRCGQIVGVTEIPVSPWGLSSTDVDDLRERFRAVPTADLWSVPDSELPALSVVIPTSYKRVDQLDKVVRSIASCPYPDVEIVVVDNRPPGGIPIPPFDGLDNVRVEVEHRPGASAARNRGARASSGSVIVFTDDDVWVDPNWLRAYGVAFALNPDLGAASGMVRPAELDTEAQLWFEEYFGGFTKSFVPRSWSLAHADAEDPLFPYAAGQFGAGNNMALRREMFELVGGFDERLGAGAIARGAEDLKLFVEVILVGGTITYLPSALVRHSHRRTRQEFREQVFSYGVGLASLYCALVTDNPRRLLHIVTRLPGGLRRIYFPTKPRSHSSVPSYPRSTSLVHALGAACGPIAFARSALAVRRRNSGRP